MKKILISIGVLMTMSFTLNKATNYELYEAMSDVEDYIEWLEEDYFQGNISQEEFDHKEFGQIFYRIDQALRQATKLAEGSLAGTRRFPDLQNKGIIKAKQKYETQLGNVDEAVSLSEQYKQLQQQVQSR